MKYNKMLILACVLTLSAGAVFGGCAQKTSDSKATSSSSGKTNEAKTDSTESSSSATALFGQITAIDGDSITLTVAPDMKNQKAPANGKKPSGSSTEMPQNGQSKDQKSSGDSTETTKKAPTDGQKPSGNSTSTEMPSQGNGGQGTSQMSGESKTITITDTTTIEKESSGSTTKGTKDDLTKGTMVSVTMDGSTVKMITIKNMSNNQKQSGTQGQSSSTETSETSAK